MTKVFWPILKIFEKGEVGSNYRNSHRVILNIVGVLFLLLSSASAGAIIYSGLFSAFIPVVIFLAVGIVAVVVGLLGSDTAVSRIWGNK